MSGASTVRRGLPGAQVLENLGLLSDLAGTWQGTGFNLVARPFFGPPKANLFLELNRTTEILQFEPILSSIPNRGTFQEDIELFGLTYLQRIIDSDNGGALHIEPGIWVTQPPTSQPQVNPPKDGQIVARMGSIPHGNALLAGGAATRFTGPPVLGAGGGVANPAGSVFPSFNSTPVTLPVSPGVLTLSAAGTQESLAAPAGGFSQYNLKIAASLTSVPPNPRSPLESTLTELPNTITQNVVNDPIVLLQDVVKAQVNAGCTFEGTVLNIATASPIRFFSTAPKAPPAGGPTLSVDVRDATGGTENLPFLKTNANTALVYSTFWITKVTPKSDPAFMQLQYAQFVLLDFPAALVKAPTPAPNPPLETDQGLLNFGWPHVSVGTLLKTFG